MTEQTANLCTTDAAESLRAVVAERDREIERLKEGQSILIFARDEQKRLANEYRDLWSRAALKAKPSGVVPELPGEYSTACAAARLNSSPVSAGGLDERAVTREQAEDFLAAYHSVVWAAAEDEDSRISYDDAGRDLAKEFLNRFGGGK